MSSSGLVTALVVAAGVSAPAMADTVSVSPIRQGSFYSENFGSSAFALPTVRAGYFNEFRGHMTFDIAPHVPAGAVITAATLVINGSIGFSAISSGTLQLWSFSGNPADIDAFPTDSYFDDLPGGVIWTALGSGTVLGSSAFANGSSNPAVFNLAPGSLSRNPFAFGLTFSVDSGRDPLDSFFATSIALQVTYSTVQVVPLPPAVWGGAAGLAGVAFIARRRRMTAN